MTGHEYADLVARYIVKNYASRGVKAYREVHVGKTLTGRGRRVDIFVLERETRTALAIECKYQGSVGTVDEKIPFALQDLESMKIPVCVAYAGDGFSRGILHILSASPIAAWCLPGAKTLAPSPETRELDCILAMTFKWWDVLVRGKKRVAL
ncbi:hypothetical protein JRI60_51410 [Archangium violaceum]|uniref:PD-(D/E)XK nuclease superfamily protein n=1 Tax=Archangium violaceum TaxID=83451 RepID=UPI001951ED5C|nr:PD-(D/E)XK nuclease superfamily protein [Archangium violaceum]QRN97264.1 hypothetical protein JRI60_51410 [Archangium violaceum]